MQVFENLKQDIGLEGVALGTALIRVSAGVSIGFAPKWQIFKK